jgi:hypothetical protein
MRILRDSDLGWQLCTVWDWATGRVVRVSQKYDVDAGALGDGAAVEITDAEAAKSRIARTALCHWA